MKKTLIFVLLFSLLLFSGCQQQPKIEVKQQFDASQCSSHGYVYYTEMNRLINLTNKLIEANNVCFQRVNLTALPSIGYISFTPSN